MFLPNVADYTNTEYSNAKTDKKIVEFKGLNLLPVTDSGEFSAMTNLSARNYPCLSPRLPRSVDIDSVSDMTAFCIVGGIKVWVQDNCLYYNGISKGALDADYATVERQLLPFQDRVLVWPDKMYYDITDNELGSLENAVSKTGLVFTASVLDSSLGNSVKYSAITASVAFSGFKEGDSVITSGCTVVADNNKTANIDHISSNSKVLYFTENTFSAGTEAVSVTLSRSIPDMDYICEANNRVWGCKKNTIYGSKLGSAENWNYFALNDSGVSSSVDSYTVDFSTPGDFTGCHQYGSYVVFMKEDFLHKIIGSKPSNYQRSDIVCPGLGLESGSHKSIAYLSGILYFKSRLGIVAFSGGSPSLASERLGNASFSNAVAITDGRHYYVSMTDGTVYSLFVYDSFYDVWHREDATQVIDFGIISGAVYMLTGGELITLNDNADNEVVAWSGTLGEFSEFSAEKKIHSRLLLRIDLPATSTLKIEYSADGGTYKTAWQSSGAARKGIYISILPTRCDSFVVRLSGTGDCKVYQMDRIFSYSTDMR